jgi:hypothetical protein
MLQYEATSIECIARMMYGRLKKVDHEKTMLNLFLSTPKDNNETVAFSWRL